jgi:hypothetical protein
MSLNFRQIHEPFHNLAFIWKWFCSTIEINTPFSLCPSCCTPNAMITLTVSDDIIGVTYNILVSLLSDLYLGLWRQNTLYMKSNVLMQHTMKVLEAGIRGIALIILTSALDVE